jgi:copper chaperone CopZ
MQDTPPPVLEFKVEGMHCMGCKRSVRKALEKLRGVIIEEVEIGSAQLRLAGATAADVVLAIQGAGYRVRVPEEG